MESLENGLSRCCLRFRIVGLALCLTCVRFHALASRSFWMACWGVETGRGRDELTGLTDSPRCNPLVLLRRLAVFCIITQIRVGLC